MKKSLGQELLDIEAEELTLKLEATSSRSSGMLSFRNCRKSRTRLNGQQTMRRGLSRLLRLAVLKLFLSRSRFLTLSAGPS